jgi:hypothetical protein
VGVEELAPSDAAGVCGITPEAFRQRLSRARARLEKELGTPQLRLTPPELRGEDGSRTAAKAGGVAT